MTASAKRFAPTVLDQESWPPDYSKVFDWRRGMILRWRKDPALADAANCWYADHPVEFITHWVDTRDTRNAYSGELPKDLPFVLFKRQAELIKFLQSCLEDQANGLIDKSRDTGVTWLASGFSIWLWRYRAGCDVGWGSRKQDLVDKIDDHKSIFTKLRGAIRRLPTPLLPKGFDPDKHLSFLRLVNPENESTITGEGGDNIGRGGRTLIYFKDESAHYEHPESIEAALMDNTNVQIDISTHNGIATVFNTKRMAGTEWDADKPHDIPKGTTRVFVFDWSDHPAKDAAWHKIREKEATDNGLLHLFRQEVDRDPTATLQGVIIPAAWVRSCVDAHIKLKLPTTGGEMAGFDPFDGGRDMHAFSRRKGIVLRECDDWGDGDTGDATRAVVQKLSTAGPISVMYDCCGIGAGVKSEANRLAKKGDLPKGLNFVAWDAGDGVLNPEARIIPGDASVPTNEDFFGNLKAQAWWSLRLRCERTHRMVIGDRDSDGKLVTFPSDQLISFDSRMPKLTGLMHELSQPIIKKSGDLKLLVDKQPEGVKSPNKADATVMCYFPVKVPMVISDAALARFGAGQRRR